MYKVVSVFTVTVEHCQGYVDSNGMWNNGFYCPRWGGPDEQYCCGDGRDGRERYCCPEPDDHASSSSSSSSSSAGHHPSSSGSHTVSPSSPAHHGGLGSNTGSNPITGELYVYIIVSYSRYIPNWHCFFMFKNSIRFYFIFFSARKC